MPVGTTKRAGVLSRKFVVFQRVCSRLLARQVAPGMAGPLPSGVTPPKALKDAPFGNLEKAPLWRCAPRQ